MNTLENKSFKLKRTYNTPEIVCIRLDNQISLQLQTTPAPPLPSEPDCVFNSPGFITNDPFKNNIS